MQLLFLGPSDMTECVEQNLPKDIEVHHATEASAVDQIIRECDIIFDAYMKIPLNRERIRAAEKLKIIVTATTGANHIDASELQKRGIPLLTMKDQREFLRNITPAAEHSWLLLMACARRLRAPVAEVVRGEWDRNKFPGMLLKGKRLGLIGCGRIGQWMARYAEAFGMKSLGYDPHLDEWPQTIEQDTLEGVIRGSDFLSIHVPLNEETEGLIGEREFALSKPGVVLVNTSRGEIVDESALLSALESGHVAAAGLDVLSGEPDIASHPLVKFARKHENLIITPHIGGYSPEALQLVLEHSCGRIRKHFGI